MKQISKIIRAYSLRKGDKFIKQGISYKVRSVKNGDISYFPLSQSPSKCVSVIGMYSQERVELILNVPGS